MTPSPSTPECTSPWFRHQESNHSFVHPPPKNNIATWARRTSGQTPKVFAMPGPWALDRGLICRAKMWQVPEGLRAHAARHAPEDGEATEARWVSRIKGLGCLGMFLLPGGSGCTGFIGVASEGLPWQLSARTLKRDCPVMPGLHCWLDRSDRCRGLIFFVPGLKYLPLHCSSRVGFPMLQRPRARLLDPAPYSALLVQGGASDPPEAMLDPVCWKGCW